MVSQVVELFASIIADRILDQVIESLSGRLNREYELLSDWLSSLDAKADAQLLGPLRAGLTFLRLGYIDKALEEFVRAEALDPYAAASKLCLGLVLRRRGFSADATYFIREAIRLNPYLIEDLVNPAALLSKSTSIAHLPEERQWNVSLLDKSVASSLPRKSFSLAPNLFAERRAAAIRFATTIAPHPVVTWLLGGDLQDSPESFASAFSRHDGRCLWSKAISDAELYLVTPKSIILKSNGDRPRFELLNVEDGSTIRAMSDGYFRLAFMGGRDVVTGGMFTNLGCHMMSLDEAYEKTKVEIAGRGIRRITDTIRAFPFTHNYEKFVETADLPFQDSRERLMLENRWRHAHVAYGDGIAACGLWASASVRVQQL